MDISSVIGGYRSWPGATWAKAVAGGVMVMMLVLANGVWLLLALILGIIGFLFVAWWTHRRDPDFASATSRGATANPRATPSAVAPTSTASVAAPVADPEAAAPATPDAKAPDDSEGERPACLDGPRDGTADDLKRIKGVGEKLEVALHEKGIYHFDQIASWGPAQIAWMDSNMAEFNGRCSRDDWVGQAKVLATGGETEFSQRVDKGEVY